MTIKSVVLTDVAENVWQEEFSLTPRPNLQLSGSERWSISKYRLCGGRSDGVDVVEVDNGAFSVSVLPTRGMNLWRGRYRDLPLGWNSPVAWPVHPAFVDRQEGNGLGWLGGFNEWLCRCGLSSLGPPGVDVVRRDDGTTVETPLTLHGKIANTPAHRVETEVHTEGPGTLSVTGVVDEAMMFGPRLRLTSTVATEAGANWLRVTDEITNLAGRPGEMQLLYHTNFGSPLLEPGSRVVAPVREVAPATPRAAEGIDHWDRYGEPVPGFAEQNYYLQLQADGRENTLVLLKNAAGDRGASLRFNRMPLPNFVVWKMTQAEADGYVTGLEPATSLPNLKTFERDQGRVVSLQPEESYRTELEIAVHVSAEEVSAVEEQIAELQGQRPPQVHPQPQPRYTPGG